MSLTFKLKMVFSVLCFFFKPASWHLLLYQYRSIHSNTHISKQHSHIKSVFHVPLLYFEHLPLQRSLHGPETDDGTTMLLFCLRTVCHCRVCLCPLTKCDKNSHAMLVVSLRCVHVYNATQ